MKRYLILILAILVLASGMVVGCAPDLPKEIYDQLFIIGNDKGYGWGYWLTAEAEKQGILEAFITNLIPPDIVDEAQKLNPKVNIRDFYTPKGYWTMEDVADTHLPDGTPFNDKQKKQAMEAYNWGFYTGFMDGSKDYLEGKPHRRFP
ncbi:MAG: hypothetical protein HYU85_02780 [Chloroflexi bacterium]|nr:hypothetical protein [Chloroflexota bacterium]MBI3931089.1 hypothetical protein [Chloroflexota bacterium]